LELDEKDGSYNVEFQVIKDGLSEGNLKVPIRVISPTSFDCSYTFEGKNYTYVFTKVVP